MLITILTTMIEKCINRVALLSFTMFLRFFITIIEKQQQMMLIMIVIKAVMLIVVIRKNNNNDNDNDNDDDDDKKLISNLVLVMPSIAIMIVLSLSTTMLSCMQSFNVLRLWV